MKIWYGTLLSADCCNVYIVCFIKIRYEKKGHFMDQIENVVTFYV